MNVIKKTQRINSTSLKIDELKDYIGTVVDIMILPHPQDAPRDKKAILSYAGSVSSIPDPILLQKHLRDEWGQRIEPAS
jgi:hypothetical protein